MTLFRSRESKIIPSDHKILIDNIAKFQAKLEAVDTFDHVIIPPLYQQVVRFESIKTRPQV